MPMPMPVWVLCFGPGMGKATSLAWLEADGCGEHVGGRSLETLGRAGLGGCVLREGAVKGKKFPSHSIFIL